VTFPIKCFHRSNYINTTSSVYVNNIIVVRVYNTSHAKFEPPIKGLSAGYDKSSPVIWEIWLSISLRNEMANPPETRPRKRFFSRCPQGCRKVLTVLVLTVTESLQLFPTDNKPTNDNYTELCDFKVTRLDLNVRN